MKQKTLFTKLIIFCCFCVFFSNAAFADDRGIRRKKSERRVALVIGNSDYKSSPLKNPANDAADMSAALKQCGFAVTKVINADRRKMRGAIRRFGDDINKGGVAGLFFYAGHGIQVKGENYLVPLDADVSAEDEVEDDCLRVSSVLRKMETAGNRLNIIILDACRDNPFGRSFRSSARGLAKMDAPAGSILAYATAPGSVAADAGGTSARNGLYTSELLKHIRTPGLEIGRLFRKVRADVMKASGKKQVPWESSSLVGDFYFGSPVVADGSAVIQQAAPEPKPKTGSLRVKTSPPGATVWVNGRNRGKSPVRADNLKPGKVRVRAAYEGYREREDVVSVEKGVVTQVNLYLDRIVAAPEPKPVAAPEPEPAVTGDIIRLRSQPRTLSYEDVKKMLVKYNFFDSNSNKSGDFENDFVKSSDGKTVTDRKTGLMWQQSGSDKRMSHNYAQAYVGKLNSRQFAGYSDWRLPTVEELASLLESKEVNGRYIDSVFDEKQYWCWSSDKRSSGSAWSVYFDYGYVGWYDLDDDYYVRGVRSRQY
ncbi:caspase family protein [Desulfococcaceae bacterium HSG8]|nr:caspase family protein [Desulfococcaceae bacterium HSG8]